MPSTNLISGSIEHRTSELLSRVRRGDLISLLAKLDFSAVRSQDDGEEWFRHRDGRIVHFAHDDGVIFAPHLISTLAVMGLEQLQTEDLLAAMTMPKPDCVVANLGTEQSGLGGIDLTYAHGVLGQLVTLVSEAAETFAGSVGLPPREFRERVLRTSRLGHTQVGSFGLKMLLPTEVQWPILDSDLPLGRRVTRTLERIVAYFGSETVDGERPPGVNHAVADAIAKLRPPGSLSFFATVDFRCWPEWDASPAVRSGAIVHRIALGPGSFERAEAVRDELKPHERVRERTFVAHPLVFREDRPNSKGEIRRSVTLEIIDPDMHRQVVIDDIARESYDTCFAAQKRKKLVRVRAVIEEGQRWTVRTLLQLSSTQTDRPQLDPPPSPPSDSAGSLW
ncbi:MAG: hypothetical protein PSV22_14405 [Pseudolabrys sp.]|nr:hypothetical protein [Pseudolabrys sp.]